jgi:hypothetical protein
MNKQTDMELRLLLILMYCTIVQSISILLFNPKYDPMKLVTYSNMIVINCKY